MNYFTVPGLKNKVYPVVANVFDKSIRSEKVEEIKYCVSPHAIMTAVCDTYKISVEILKKKSNKRISVEPRQVAFFLMKNKTLLSLEAIGELFGKNHATVIHGLNTCKNEIDCDTVMGNIINKLMQEL